MKENKQYKLKRWYPSLKKTVEVGCIITKIYTCGGYHYRGSDNEGVIFYVSGSQCENNPDFWEEMKQPLFVTDDGVELFTTSDLVLVVNSQFKTSMWSVGEYMKAEKSGNLKVFYRVDSANKYIEDNKPKSLFITEDGVEVFKPRGIWSVNKKTLEIEFPYVVKPLKEYLYFVYKSNADEYVVWHKKWFSVNDLLLADIGITTNQLDKLHQMAIKKNIING